MEQLQKLLPFLLMFVIIFFFMILPQQKRAKKERAFESSLKVGDKIITKSGLHGRISELSEGTVVIETMSGKLKMERSAISMEMSAKQTPAIVADSKKA
ncbi:MAG TPA: preprotein translocase subunit YajC [Flavobacterium sp.]|jgi:preprotein translocase subunit YajC